MRKKYVIILITIILALLTLKFMKEVNLRKQNNSIHSLKAELKQVVIALQLKASEDENFVMPQFANFFDIVLGDDKGNYVVLLDKMNDVKFLYTPLKKFNDLLDSQQLLKVDQITVLVNGKIIEGAGVNN